MARTLLASLLGLVGTIAVACTPPPSLQLRGPILQAYPSIAAEIVTCVQRPEVHTVLGFNPLPQKVIVSVREYAPQNSADGQTYDETNASINALPYLKKVPSRNSLRSLFLRNSGPVQGEADEHFHQRMSKIADHRYEALTSLVEDPALGRWYRCGIVVHELSHIKWKQDSSYRESGHGVTDRIETRLYTHAYQQGVISRELWQRLYGFTVRFMNYSLEPAEAISLYREQVLANNNYKQ